MRLINDESIMLIERTSDLLEDPEILSDFIKCYEHRSEQTRHYAVVDASVLDLSDSLDVSSIQVLAIGD